MDLKQNVTYGSNKIYNQSFLKKNKVKKKREEHSQTPYVKPVSF